MKSTNINFFMIVSVSQELCLCFLYLSKCNFNFYRSNYELKCEKVARIDAQVTNMVFPYMLVT